ncbi:MAG: hypothetical protein RSA49_00150 [Anaerovoracaceae bacterium]
MMKQNRGKYINADKLKTSMGKAKCIGQCSDYVEGWFTAINQITKIIDDQQICDVVPVETMLKRLKRCNKNDDRKR